MNDSPPPDGLRDLIDSSFGDGPAPLAPVDRLAAARRVLRRRRAASGVLTAVVVAAAASLAQVAVPDGTRSAVAPAASSPTAPPTTTASADTATDVAVTDDGLSACLETLGLLLDARVAPPSLAAVDVTYNPETRRLDLAPDAVISAAPSDRDPATVDCAVDGVRVSLPTRDADRTTADTPAGPIDGDAALGWVRRCDPVPMPTAPGDDSALMRRVVPGSPPVPFVRVTCGDDPTPPVEEQP